VLTSQLERTIDLPPLGFVAVTDERATEGDMKNDRHAPAVGRLWPNQCGGTSRGPAPCVTPRWYEIQVQGGPVPGLTADGRIGAGPAGCAAAGGRISRPWRSKMSPSRVARLPP
jgi:hypothetical protein